MERTERHDPAARSLAAHLAEQAVQLGISLAHWDARGTTTNPAAARYAAARAVTVIDGMLAELYVARAALAAECRRADDRALADADETLARHRRAAQ